MREGVRVYEEDYKFLHMKAYFVDERELSIGSMNNDQWSFFCNNEANLYFRSEHSRHPVMRRFSRIVGELKGQCSEVRQEEYAVVPGASAKFWKHGLNFFTWVMKNRALYK